MRIYQNFIIVAPVVYIIGKNMYVLMAQKSMRIMNCALVVHIVNRIVQIMFRVLTPKATPTGPACRVAYSYRKG